MVYHEMMGSPYPSMMSIRPPHDAYRSLPGTPLGVDSRAMAPTDISLAMNHARMGLDVPDYFSPGAGSMGQRFNSGMNPRSPFPNDMENERFSSSYGGGEASTSDMICRYASILVTMRDGTNTVSLYSSFTGPISPHNSSTVRYPIRQSTAKCSVSYPCSSNIKPRFHPFYHNSPISTD